MSSTTFCEILKSTCNYTADAQCGKCPTARKYLEQIAIEYRQNDVKKRILKFFDKPDDSLSLKHQEHHAAIARITRGSIFSSLK